MKLDYKKIIHSPQDYLERKISMVSVKQPIDQHQSDVDKKEESKCSLNTSHGLRQNFGPCQGSFVHCGPQGPGAHFMEYVEGLIKMVFMYCQQ